MILIYQQKSSFTIITGSGRTFLLIFQCGGGWEMRLLLNELGLRTAIYRKELHVYLQPQVSIDSWRTVSVEALVKTYGERELNDDFRTELEQVGLVHLLDLYLLQEVCRMVVRWQREYLAPQQVSLKFSRRTMERKDITERAERILKAHPGAASMLSIEVNGIYEGGDWKRFCQNCRRFCQMGIRLILGNYGAGTTDDCLLSEAWFDEVKIDRSLIRQLERRTMDYLKVRVIIDLCKKMNRQVTAVGVENWEQYRELEKLGCDKMQGFFADQVMRISEFECKYLSKRLERIII